MNAVPNPNPVRAALYGRYSTQYQSKKSVEDQHRECEEHAAKEGFEVVARFGDKEVSGGTAARPGYQAMAEAARQGKMDVIIAEDVSRMWRNRNEYGNRSTEFEDLGIGLLTCVGDDTRRDGWMIVTIKLAMAEAYRKEVAYRTRRGLRGRALQGLSTGGKAYGYQKSVNAQGEKIRVIVPHEAKIVVQIYEWRAAGRSGQDIARQLNADGVPPPGAGWNRTRTGPHAKNPAKGWTHSCIVGDPRCGTGILNNPIYKGVVRWGFTTWTASARDSKDRIVKAQEDRNKRVERPPDESLRIVSDELWNKVHATQTASNPRREAVRLGVAKRNFRYRSKYLLGGTLVCGECGCNYIGDGQKDYLCPAHTVGHCSNDMRFRRADIHEAIVDHLTEHLLSDEAVARGRERIEAVLREEQCREQTALRRSEDSSEMRRLEEQAAALRGMNLPRGVITAALAEIEREREELRARAAGSRPAKEHRAQRLLARLPEIVAEYKKQVAQAVKVLAQPEVVAEAGEAIRRLLEDGRILLVPNADRTGVVGPVHLKELGDHVLQLAGWRRNTKQIREKLSGSGGLLHELSTRHRLSLAA